MRLIKLYMLITVIGLAVQSRVLAQGQPYQGPDDPAGDIAAEREGWMNGNRVFIYFQNTTELSYCCGTQYSRWPNDFDGLSMTDGIGLLIGARVYVRDDTIPVTNLDEAQSDPAVEPVYYLQTSYRERMDKNHAGTLEWGLYPVFGYFNELSEYPAMSSREESWPPLGWPARGDELKWPGEWNGRFGRGVKYADLETYFVANDAQDQENLQSNRRLRYYPRPGVHIGDKKADVTIQSGKPWGGIGIRVSQRGYQWNNPQTRDAIFWEYDISNISDYDLNEMAFGYWVDNGIGNNDPDDIAYFDKKLDMCYSWDVDGIGQGGLRTGIMGLAYLESPGLAYDNEDNDDDGLLNERRDNQASQLIGPTDGIQDLQKFMDAYGYTSVDQLKEHWDADEDQDWQDGNDENGNGVYDLFENPGDDVGLDGVGPGELNYSGPDMDGSEGNHKPDFLEGVGCEPNFAATDVSESDMVGLTSFKLFPIDHGAFTWFEFDKPMFELMSRHALEEYIGDLSNLVEIFASGLFPLKQGRTERISMSELHSYEELSGLNSSAHDAPALFEKKRIVQFIYESDYRFAQPPLLPTLKAVAGDGKVILTWNDRSDKYTREPMLRGINDFEGYKLYKATDKYFADAELLMDMYGNPIGKKPIFQCDIKDGRRGAADYANINGELFYLGTDSGIKHHFVDENVQNGRTYYYGLVAYDYGLDGLEVAIMPSENNVVIDLDEQENVRFTGKNVAIVTPEKEAAGYVPPSITIHEQETTIGSGYVVPQIFDKKAVKAGHTYQVVFNVDTIGHFNRISGTRHPYDLIRSNDGLRVYDATMDSLVYRENPTSYPMNNIKKDGKIELAGYKYFKYIDPGQELTSDVFDGLQLKFFTGTDIGEYDAAHSGWVVGNSNMRVRPANYSAKHAFAYSYDIIFTSNDTIYPGANKKMRGSILDVDGQIPINLSVPGQPAVFYELPFNFYVINRLFPDSAGQFEKLGMVGNDLNENGQFDLFEDEILVSHVFTKSSVLGTRSYWGGTIFSIDFHDVPDENGLPKAGDVYRVEFKRPFSDRDTLTFTVNPQEEVNAARLASDLDKIMVVPNPYVATNSMETAISNPNLNQRRKLMFTHVPAECEIKIFSTSGTLIRELQIFNPPERGIVHWDMLTKEGLEIAPGIYIYYVRSTRTGQEKTGKFAVIK